jgi:hypothetical protein
MRIILEGWYIFEDLRSIHFHFRLYVAALGLFSLYYLPYLLVRTEITPVREKVQGKTGVTFEYLDDYEDLEECAAAHKCTINDLQEKIKKAVGIDDETDGKDDITPMKSQNRC